MFVTRHLQAASSTRGHHSYRRLKRYTQAVRKLERCLKSYTQAADILDLVGHLDLGLLVEFGCRAVLHVWEEGTWVVILTLERKSRMFDLLVHESGVGTVVPDSMRYLIASAQGAEGW